MHLSHAPDNRAKVLGEAGRHDEAIVDVRSGGVGPLKSTHEKQMESAARGKGQY